MEFQAISPLGEDILREYQESITYNISKLSILHQKLQSTDLNFILITPDFPTCNRNYDGVIAQDLIELSKAWGIVRGKGLEDIKQQKLAWTRIDKIGNRLPGHIRRSNPTIRRFRSCKGSNFFFLLLTGTEPDIFPVYELNALCNIWQLEKGSIPIHSGGIGHKGNLFLFGGPSGAGKSTVSAMSTNQRDWVLDEDQLLLKLQPDGSYLAQAWGYSLQTSEAPLKAVFKLIKDTEDRLIRFSRSQTTRFIMERTMDVMGSIIEKKHIDKTFHFVAELSRSIPGYELHFRKSPDFWKLIDAEFGLE